MKIELRLYASLARYMPVHGDRRGAHQTIEIKEGTTIGSLLENLKVPTSEVKLIFVNGVHAALGQVLKDGDRVGIFPPVAGG
ncbi:MAG: MoaD/ThiS family protein [Desulfobacteraceae bacterium]|jgi:molybdopterin converting factor small subunit